MVVLQELHNSLYFCQVEDTNVFDLAETIPGKSTDEFGKLAKELGVVIVLSLFEKRAAGLYHNTAVVIEKMELLQESIEKCIFLTIQLITKNFIYTWRLGFSAN